jgi:hypothetical protein
MNHGPRTTQPNYVRAEKLRFHRFAQVALLSTTLLAFGQANPTSTKFSTVMSLGSDSILLQPAKERLNMLLSVECPGMEKIVLDGNGSSRIAVSDDGSPVRFYPQNISFRFTIGSRTSADEPQPNEVETKATADHFQSNLHFRLKVFHGMHSKSYDPVEVRMLGVPADIPYDERIYHFTFKVKDVPVDDRMMLEILDEQGNRVGKFHLQIL